MANKASIYSSQGSKDNLEMKEAQYDRNLRKTTKGDGAKGLNYVMISLVVTMDIDSP